MDVVQYKIERRTTKSTKYTKISRPGILYLPVQVGDPQSDAYLVSCLYTQNNEDVSELEIRTCISWCPW